MSVDKVDEVRTVVADGGIGISIVVPVYNEKESLPELMSGIAEVLNTHVPNYEVVLVDDGSNDGSFDVIRSLYSQYKGRVKAIRFSRNCGKSAALNAGIAQAGGEVIVTMDADLQDDPVAIPEMMAKLNEGWDVVSGWKKVRHDPLGKTFPSKVWNAMTSAAAGLKLHDFNCGFKAYRRTAAKNLDIYGERHRYLPAMAHWDGCRVTEIVVPHHARKFGKSKYGTWRMFNGAMDMITLLFLKHYMKSPMHFFGIMGMLMIGIGVGILGYFGVQWAIYGEMRIRPLTILAIGSMVMGVQFMSIGLIGEMITNSQQSRRQYSIREKLE
ncbi:MAG: glycosyltransferase family 2 protein [Chitinispirillia bacterium]|nr:glycosyltransferase family 2 protein [Chitinispirillia bacterium]MCL2267596.1 glycosyltransferase family 2 protein [Chitinispirillia bacterium]